MKKITIVIVAIIFSCTALAQGVEFEQGTFNEALTKAKEENKLLFMDCYTSWCGPCKKMNKEVFPLEKVGAYFNENFVSIKFDMEKGEGIELKKKYGVQAYPTLLFIDVNGKEVYRMVGGKNAEDLIAGAEKALNPDMRLDALTKRYNDGERNIEFVLDYIDALNEAFDRKKSVEVSKELVKTLPIEKFNTKKMFNVLASTNVEYGTEAFNYIVKNKEQLFTAVDTLIYHKAVNGAVSKYLFHQAETVNTLEELNAEIKRANKNISFQVESENKSLKREYLYTFYETQKDFDTWFALKMEEANKEKGTENYKYRLQSIGSIAIFSPAFDKSKRVVDTVLKIGNDLVDIEESYFMGNLLLAKVYLKLKDKEKAMECYNIVFEEFGMGGDRKDILQ